MCLAQSQPGLKPRYSIWSPEHRTRSKHTLSVVQKQELHLYSYRYHKANIPKSKPESIHLSHLLCSCNLNIHKYIQQLPTTLCFHSTSHSLQLSQTETQKPNHFTLFPRNSQQLFTHVKVNSL